MRWLSHPTRLGYILKTPVEFLRQQGNAGRKLDVRNRGTCFRHSRVQLRQELTERLVLDRHQRAVALAPHVLGPVGPEGLPFEVGFGRRLDRLTTADRAEDQEPPALLVLFFGEMFS